MSKSSFDSILVDYAFFMAQSTEAAEDIEAIREELGRDYFDLPRSVLDFGSGTGRFLHRLVSDNSQKHVQFSNLTLVEPGSGARSYAGELLKDFASELHLHPGLTGVDHSPFDLILANHSLYYVANLRHTLLALFDKLKEGGRLIISMASSTNTLIDYWLEGFGIVDREVPYHLGDGVPKMLWRAGIDYKKIEVPYELRFEDNIKNRVHLISFLFKKEIPEDHWPELLEYQDKFMVGDEIVIRTSHDMIFVAK